MQPTIDLQAITDRVLGLSTPCIPAPARPARRADRPIGLILLLISALASATSLGLWAEGSGGWALRLFALTSMMLALCLRFV